MVGERLREQLDAVVEIREQRAVQVIVRQVRRHPVDVEGVEMRCLLALHHNRHRAEQGRAITILGGRRRTRRIRDRTGPEQNQAVDTLRIELEL